MLKTQLLCATILLTTACGGGSIGNSPRQATDAGVVANDATQQQTPPVTTTEVCNGFDDDADGQVDEGCGCTRDEQQACYPGPEQQLLGLCATGEQACVGAVEFGQWGDCVGAVTPQTEICGDGIDQDCDGSDLACPPRCGDDQCNDNETCETCPGDCGACPPVCGDQQCNGDETCETCPGDCGACPVVCDTFTFGLDARAIDIIWVIDQSGSMNTEIAAVRAGMNDFAAFISATQIDYRVVVVAERGTGTRDICIASPLGGVNCADGPRFKQVDVRVASHDGLDKLVDNLNAVESFLRPGSLRHVVMVTDDESTMSAATFSNHLANHGGFDDYLFHGIIGTSAGGCVAGVGNVYMQLIAQTGGLQFHICNADWTQLFTELGTGVAEVAITQYDLSHAAIPGTVTVQYDANQAQEGVQWTYDAANSRVVLQGTLPADGTTITACYQRKP